MADNYDPYEHREVLKPLLYWEALVQVVKSSVGSGCLAMPKAFSNAGWIVGLVCTFVIGFIVAYALHILIEGFYILSKRNKVPGLTFPAAMTLALQDGPPCMRRSSKAVGYLCDVFLFTYHFGICAVYCVFVATTIKKVVDGYNGPDINSRLYVLMLLLPLIAVFLIRRLKYLVPFSIIATILLLVGICVVFYYIFRSLPYISEREFARPILEFPLFFGVVLFAIEAPGVMIAVEAEMKNPKRFLGWGGVLAIGMMFVVSLYGIFGFFGYWHFGQETRGTVTHNLPNDTPGVITNIGFAIGIFLSYPLQGYVTIDVTWHHYCADKYEEKKRTLYEYILRVCIAIGTVVLAIALPEVHLLVGLIGSVCLSILGLVFPGLLDLCIRYVDGYGKGKKYLIRDISLILFGAIGGAIGTGVSIYDIYCHFAPNDLGEDAKFDHTV